MSSYQLNDAVRIRWGENAICVLPSLASARSLHIPTQRHESKPLDLSRMDVCLERKKRYQYRLKMHEQKTCHRTLPPPLPPCFPHRRPPLTSSLVVDEINYPTGQSVSGKTGMQVV